MKRKYIVVLFILVGFIVLTVLLCFRNSNPNLKKSLDLSGRNRTQLLQVLNYYSNPKDSLKRKAALFLIENMFIHYSYYGKGIEQYNRVFDKLDTLNHIQTGPVLSLSKQVVKSNMGNLKTLGYSQLSDCEIATSSYLINNIELAFQAWKQMPWSKNVNFSDFCEYILPYRTRKEKLEYWRPRFQIDYTEVAQKCKHKNDLSEVYVFMKSNLADYFNVAPELGSFYPFDQSIINLSKTRTGTCVDMSSFSAAAMRSAGLPVAIDYIPFWGNFSNSHSMIHLITKNASNKRITNINSAINTTDIVDVSMDYNPASKVFLSTELPIGLSVQYNKTIPKVYRYTYSAQPEMREMLNVEDKTEIAPEFNILNIKDVSDEYLKCSTIDITINPKFQKYQIVYLCVFDINSWKPVALTRINAHRKAIFTKIGRNIVYLPTVYKGKEYLPIERPFSIDSLNKIHYLAPNKEKKQNLRLIRKFPLFVYTANHSLKLKGGRFEGSNSPDFKNAQLLYEIDYFPFYMNQKSITGNNRFRYLRYLPPTSSDGNIAEVEFYGINKGDTTLLKGTVIGEPGSENHDPAKAFDQNMDTYYENNINNGWVGLDLGADNKQKVTKIRFCPRNDTNCIMPGSSYELYCWNNRWMSLGIQKADKAYLIYNNLPSGALYWLKCLSGGKEERIFTYEKGMQVWW